MKIKNLLILVATIMVPMVNMCFVSCGSDEDAQPQVSNEIIGSWIEEGIDPNGYEVFHMDFTANTFEEYVTYEGKKSTKTYTGTWTYNKPLLSLKYFDGEEDTVQVHENRFSIDEITFIKNKN